MRGKRNFPTKERREVEIYTREIRQCHNMIKIERALQQSRNIVYVKEFVCKEQEFLGCSLGGIMILFY